MLLMPPDPNAKPLDEGTLSVETEMADQNWPGKAKCPPRVAQPTNGGTQEGRSNAQSDPQISPEKKMVSGLAGPTAQGSDPALLSGPAPKPMLWAAMINTLFFVFIISRNVWAEIRSQRQASHNAGLRVLTTHAAFSRKPRAEMSFRCKEQGSTRHWPHTANLAGHSLAVTRNNATSSQPMELSGYNERICVRVAKQRQAEKYTCRTVLPAADWHGC